MPVVGTAGHVDHGKSTLVKTLTGRDPDRWEEEKRRGLTIDLGFSWTTLPDGTEVSFVDVPGHESFMRNMLAGVGAIDVALLVVAADEGWMPQTEEHVAVLDLLEVDRCVVALTKIDKVGPGRIEQMTEQIQTELEGTTLAGSRVVPVSAHDATGVGELTAALSSAIAAGVPTDRGRPRLWIDRSFSVPGVGTVVTGTLVDGRLEVNQRIAIWPGEIESRVRSLQSHEKSIASAEPGRRVAIGLVGVDRQKVPRGHMIGLPGQWVETERALLELRQARYSDELSEKGAYQFHIGSGTWSGRLRLLGPTTAMVRLSRSLCLQVGDRMVIRDVGRRLVVGAGTVLDPAPGSGPLLRQSLGVLTGITEQGPDARATTLLSIRGMESLRRLDAQSGGGRPTAGIEADDIAISPARMGELLAESARLVRVYHQEHPLDKGLPKATLASRLRTTASVLNRLLEQSGDIVDRGEVVAASDFQPMLSTTDAEAWDGARARLGGSGLEVPMVKDLGVTESLLHHIERQGGLVRITREIAYLPEQVQQLLGVIETLGGPFTVSDFRQAAGISRRYAVPFLEWTDQQRITRRQGDNRVWTGGGGGRESNPPGTVSTPHRF